MVRLFLIAFGIFRRRTARFFKNIGDRFLILFQTIHERVKYRSKRYKAVWGKVKLTREQKRAINAYYKENYGKRIPYTYHRLFTAFTGNFDEKYIPEMLYAPCLERFLTDLSFGRVFTNKNTLSIFARGMNVKMPQNIVVCNNGFYYDGYMNKISEEESLTLVNNIGKVFIKKTTDSCGGNGCFIADFVDGVDRISNMTTTQLLASLGTDFCLQEILVCHESIRKIYPNSVNTFRVISYIMENKVYFCPVIMRMGRGGSVMDNASAGGIFIAVDNDGTLHKTAFTEYGEPFNVHPDTQIVFEGQKIEHLDKIFEVAEKMQLAIPQVRVVNWDFTINQDGEPILIEANMKNGTQAGSIWLPQMAHGKGAFGDNTAKVLQYIRKAKKKPLSKRDRVKF